MIDCVELTDPLRVYSFAWDDTFTIPAFKKAIDEFNAREADASSGWRFPEILEDTPSIEGIARVSYADSIQDVLSPAHDLVIPLVVGVYFLKFANEMISTAIKEAKLSSATTPQEPPLTILAGGLGSSAGDSDSEDIDERYDEGSSDRLALWRFNNILNWQMLDRRIDECVLSSSHRCGT